MLPNFTEIQKIKKLGKYNYRLNRKRKKVYEIWKHKYDNNNYKLIIKSKIKIYNTTVDKKKMIYIYMYICI